MITLAITEADGFALAMLSILALSFGFVLVLLVAMVRNGRKVGREVEDLIDEVSEPPPETPAPARAAPAEEPREPWEKQSDWWKT